jgi:hypothetical protein
LRALLQELSERHWQHPIRPGEQIRFSFSTIERWYYTAKEAGNPIDALRRSVREDAGGSKVFHDSLAHELTEQYHKSPHWTYQLHHANLAILVDENRSGPSWPPHGACLPWAGGEAASSEMPPGGCRVSRPDRKPASTLRIRNAAGTEHEIRESPVKGPPISPLSPIASIS